MIKIDYPPPSFRIKKENEKDFIFDRLRRKWLLLTAEEWVRQNFVQFLVQVKAYPSSLVALEKEIMLGELKKRFDILVYNKDHQPWMIVECKGQDVGLNKDVLNQALRYHISVPTTYIVITNGSYCYAWKKDKGRIDLINELPEFNEL